MTRGQLALIGIAVLVMIIALIGFIGLQWHQSPAASHVGSVPAEISVPGRRV